MNGKLPSMELNGCQQAVLEEVAVILAPQLNRTLFNDVADDNKHAVLHERQLSRMAQSISFSTLKSSLRTAPVVGSL